MAPTPTDANDPVTGGTTNGNDDTDNDGVPDGLEVYACATYPTLDNCPIGDLNTPVDVTPNQDTDGDDVADILEIKNWHRPNRCQRPSRWRKRWLLTMTELDDSLEKALCELYPTAW